MLAFVASLPAAAQDNDRPAAAMPPAHALIPQCRIAVQFNEDEAAVRESDYLDGMFCLGVMEGILAVNTHLSAYMQPLFCPPGRGIKTWIAAKVIVDYAEQHPDLLDLEEGKFAINALADRYPCGER